MTTSELYRQHSGDGRRKTTTLPEIYWQLNREQLLTLPVLGAHLDRSSLTSSGCNRGEVTVTANWKCARVSMWVVVFALCGALAARVEICR